MYYRTALEAVAYLNDPRAIDLALQVLSREQTTSHRVIAVTAIQYNIENTGADRPDAIAELKALENRTHEDTMVRRRAYSALNSLEEKEVIEPRTRPSELER